MHFRNLINDQGAKKYQASYHFSVLFVKYKFTIMCNGFDVFNGTDKWWENQC